MSDHRPPAGDDAAGDDASMVTSFDHVALAVADLPRAVTLFCDVLGFEFVGGGDNPELKVRAVQLRLPGSTKVELLTPLTPDSYLAAHLDRAGQGIHHATMYVDDVDGAAATLEEAGYGTVDTTTARASWHETFLRPSSGFGTLVQLARPAVPWTAPLAGVTLDDVLAGRVQVLANVVTWKDTGVVVVPADHDAAPQDHDAAPQDHDAGSQDHDAASADHDAAQA